MLYARMGTKRRFNYAFNSAKIGKANKCIYIAFILTNKLKLVSGLEWDQELPLTQIAMNKKINSLTRASPFQILHFTANNIFN